MRTASLGIIQPEALKSGSGRAVWETIAAAETGDLDALKRTLAADPELSRAQYWYTQPIHFAVRSGNLETVQLLLAAGADPEWNGYHDGSLIEMARERGHEAVARALEEARERLGRVAPGEDHPIHRAAQAGDAKTVRAMLDADPSLIERGDRIGGSPLHRATIGSARRVIGLLLDRGARIHAVHSTSRGGDGGWWATRVQAIDLAIWGWNNLAPARGDFRTARLLVARGAEHDLTVASALGDSGRVQAILDAEPKAVREMRANGRRPLTAAVQFGHREIARLLLGRGADPTWPEFGAERGAALRDAVTGRGNRKMVELLLAHGADPNGVVDSGGSAIFAASPKFRPLLAAHGGELDVEDFVWLNDDEEVIRRAEQDPESIGGSVLTTAVTSGKRGLLERLFSAGVRPPAVLTECQSYLLHDEDMLRSLLEHGMTPDLVNWQHQTLLHLVCGRPDAADTEVRLAGILLDAGADIAARDDEYESTPLAWAARTNAVKLVEFLLARGAPIELPDDRPWATPLAWAERRRHRETAAILRRHGAGA